MPTILIVEDAAGLAEVIRRELAAAGYSVSLCGNGLDAVAEITARPPDLIILDWMLPGIDGLEVLRRARPLTAAPVLMLTARGEEADRVIGLEMGADDYLAKPFSMRELVARVRALLRRGGMPVRSAPVLRFQGLDIDLVRREVVADTRLVGLTGVEFKLLVALAERAGQPLSREQLSAAVQAGPYRPQDRTVDVQVARLRRKLREASPGKEWIDTVRGEGYVFVPR